MEASFKPSNGSDDGTGDGDSREEEARSLAAESTEEVEGETDGVTSDSDGDDLLTFDPFNPDSDAFPQTRTPTALAGPAEVQRLYQAQSSLRRIYHRSFSALSLPQPLDSDINWNLVARPLAQQQEAAELKAAQVQTSVGRPPPTCHDQTVENPTSPQRAIGLQGFNEDTPPSGSEGSSVDGGGANAQSEICEDDASAGGTIAPTQKDGNFIDLCCSDSEDDSAHPAFFDLT